MDGARSYRRHCSEFVSIETELQSYLKNIYPSPAVDPGAQNMAPGDVWQLTQMLMNCADMAVVGAAAAADYGKVRQISGEIDMLLGKFRRIAVI